jgi:hypothetical protein
MQDLKKSSVLMESNGANKTELSKLKDWVEAEKSKGLKDIKFFHANVSEATVESFSKDVNDMLNGQEVAMPDLD